MYIKWMKFVLLVASLIISTFALSIEQVVDVQVSTDRAAASSQQRIDKYNDQASAALRSYRSAIQRAESLTVYNRQLQRLIESQKSEIDSVKRQTDEIETIETGVLPFMLEMVGMLEQMVDADVPFLREERDARVANLNMLVDRADVTVGEKYRRIMEAYMIEADYGRTIEAYRGELAIGSSVRSVDFLRIGRIGLYYQTLDGSETGSWSKVNNEWQMLPGKFRRPVRDGMSIARKQAPPTLLQLPFSAPEVTQ